jgi:hypothetical protein
MSDFAQILVISIGTDIEHMEQAVDTVYQRLFDDSTLSVESATDAIDSRLEALGSINSLALAEGIFNSLVYGDESNRRTCNDFFQMCFLQDLRGSLRGPDAATSSEALLRNLQELRALLALNVCLHLIGDREAIVPSLALWTKIVPQAPVCGAIERYNSKRSHDF